MRIDIDSFECIGGMRPLDGGSPFDSASLIVRDREAPERIARVMRYEDPRHAVGEPLTPQEWQALCEAEHAHAFASPVPLQFGARMWMLAPTFERRGPALQELRLAGVLLEAMHDLRTDADVLIVRENDANPLRDTWAEQAYERSMEEAHIGRWERALSLAEQAWVLGRGPIPKHWALLAVCYDRLGRHRRAEGMIQVALRSHGEAMAGDVRESRETIERALKAPGPAVHPTTRRAQGSWAKQMRLEAHEHKEDTLRHLVPKGIAA